MAPATAGKAMKGRPAPLELVPMDVTPTAFAITLLESAIAIQCTEVLIVRINFALIIVITLEIVI
jgi:hypothetical protein